MPLIDVIGLTAHTRLGLWRMDESPQELCIRFPHLQHLEQPFRNEVRHCEFLSVRALLAIMTGETSLTIGHLESGKPVVPGLQISISHTRGYAALMLSDCENVAVDIEERSDRVVRVADRFMSLEERLMAPDVEDVLLVWSAKETLFKLHSEDQLHYFEMCLRSLETGNRLLMENLRRQKIVGINYAMTDDYCLTYALEPLLPAQ
jgi:phosphopantetheinyl transferase